jgi:kumamolisin
MSEGFTPSPGSERVPLDGARVSGPVPADEAVEVTVYLRPDPANEEPPPGAIVGREELGRYRGASREDEASVLAFAAERGLTVVESDRARRRIVLRGAAGVLGQAFGVNLQRFDHPSGSYRGHEGPVVLPRGMAEPVVAVLGLDDRPQASAHFRLQTATTGTSYTPVQVAAAYDYPSGVDGAGHTIGFIELGGGFTSADLSAYFTGLGLKTPAVTAVSVDSATNSPGGGAGGADGEVMLDLEVAGAIANGAALAVYFAPNTDRGFVDAVSAAVHDTTHSPSVVSISWGGPESSYTAASRQAFEDVLTDASLAGVTVCVAAGDNGSSDGAAGGQPTVDYPASSPQVLACGGTRLHITSGSVGTETVWNDGASGGATGGGVSAAFPLPGWQSAVGVPASAAPGGGTGRGVPDVAGDADPATGYQIRVDGTDTVVGGTSAVAPLWAALITLAVQTAGRPLGFVNPTLYSHFGVLPALTSAFRDIVSGDNGAYQAGAGWDPCTGLGTPKGAAIVASLAQH